MSNLLNPNELAARLGVPVSWIYDRTRKGGPEILPHIKVGKYVRFEEEKVMEYLRAKGRPDPSL
ncbi:MAG: helix-turn-helix domain-containing protein [bacterium]